GCGRTFSVWVADKVKRLFIDANGLWDFLDQATRSGNKFRSFGKLESFLSDSAPYRIWKRFLKAQAAIRTALTNICPPPKQSAGDDAKGSSCSAAATIAHLQAAFKGSALSPIAAFQAATQRFFM
ncbi:MAG: hypothetical protein R3C05_31975, partial [Pirellulaceae bacterium]